MLKKRQYPVLFLILGSILLNVLYAPPFKIYFDDKEIFQYAGMAICKGAVPYLDFFDHKPPLIYFFNAVDFWTSPWVFWIFDTLLVVFATLLFYWLCRKNKMSWPWFLPVLFNLMLRDSLVCFGNGMTREYTAVFMLIFFCVMQGNARYKYYIIGFLTGLSFWLQQDALLTMAPLGIYALVRQDPDNSFSPGQKILSGMAGFLTVTLPILIYFRNHHALMAMWKDAFLFNIHPPGPQAGFLERIKSVKHYLHQGEYEMAFYISLVLGICALFLKTNRKGLVLMGLLTVILSFSDQLLTGRLTDQQGGFIYYLLPLAASVPILVYLVFTETQGTFMQERSAQMVFGTLLCLNLSLGFLRYVSSFKIQKNPWAVEALTQKLDSSKLSDYDLYVFDDSNLIYFYNHYKILSPSRWIYTYLWNWSNTWDSDHRELNSIKDDLLRHKTRWVLDCSVARNDMKDPDAFRLWQDFLRENYSVAFRDPLGRILWQKK